MVFPLLRYGCLVDFSWNNLLIILASTIIIIIIISSSIRNCLLGLVSGIDGQSRTSDEHTDRPLQVRHEQKKAKYGPIADRHNLQFVPAVFSHTGQIHAPFKSFVMEQIRHKLIAFEGKAKVSRIKAVMKWWTKCISMVIAKTASRNVAFKSDKLMDALFREGQSGPQTPQTVFDADFEGLTSNAELYIFNQEDSQE